MGSSIKYDLKYGLELLNNWIFNSLPDSTITICLNRFLNSINPEIIYNSGFRLHGSFAIYIPPHDLNYLDFLLHEIFHSLIYESKLLQSSEEIKKTGNHFSSYLKNKKSPIPFWTWVDIYIHEIEEIIADFVAGEAYKEISRAPMLNQMSFYFLMDLFGKNLILKSILNVRHLQKKNLTSTL